MNKEMINIDPLISTRNFLAEIIENARNDYEKAGAIQAFEVCYELAKNTIRKVLLLRAEEVHTTPQRNISFSWFRRFNSQCRNMI